MSSAEDTAGAGQITSSSSGPAAAGEEPLLLEGEVRADGGYEAGALRPRLQLGSARLGATTPRGKLGQETRRVSLERAQLSSITV